MNLNTDEKVRLRTDAELKLQNEGLISIKKILDEIKVINYLSSGTLLGAVREKDFIRWDWDVQMYLLMENAFPLRYKISESLSKGRFSIYKFIDSEDSLKWDVRKNGIVFELTAWSLDGKWRHRKKKSMKVPSYLFNGNCEINFKGVNYRTLNPPEDYLEFCYGNWKTPIRTSDKKIYMTSEHWRDNTKFNKSLNFLKKILRSLLIFSNNKK
jgi:phosphorylcholine metabolism protein LicD